MSLARIEGSNDTSVLRIKKFLGLNENPDGDTTLKIGEMAEMRNFRITQDNHLQIRPGSKTVVDLVGELSRLAIVPEQRLYGAWYGTVGGRDHMLANYGGYILDIDPAAGNGRLCGLCAAAETTFFGFGNKVYLLNGQDYMSWDGADYTQFASVEGYIPLVQVATTPAGDGQLLENVNRLTGKRRVSFSPDGEATTFQLPEKNLSAVLRVTMPEGDVDFEADLAAGTVTLTTAPALGTATMEVTYSVGEGARQEVTAMRYSELFNGSSDARVFLYGDGSNRAIYSGVEYGSGQPSAEYFPDLYEMRVGESNTPITALARHYSRLMAYKPGSAWVIQYGSVTLDDGINTAAFYVQPVNRQFGNDAPGQVKLLENSPLTLDMGSVYRWKGGAYNGYAGGSESNASRISDRVGATLRTFTLKDVKTFNHKAGHEFFFLHEREALVLNYANDTWYYYRGLPFDLLLEAEGEVYGLSHEGRVLHFSRSYRSDNGEPIDCYAVSGAMDFSRDWQLKYSPMLFVAMQPESNARISVTVDTDRRSDYPERPVAYSLATFAHVDFGHYSFRTNRKPQVKRLKMKVKKAIYYRLIFKSCSASSTATIIETDVQVRYAGSVK